MLLQEIKPWRTGNALEAISYLGNDTVGSGWLARARRLIKEYELHQPEGELQVLESCLAGDDPDSAEKLARIVWQVLAKNRSYKGFKGHKTNKTKGFYWPRPVSPPTPQGS